MPPPFEGTGARAHQPIPQVPHQKANRPQPHPLRSVLPKLPKKKLTA